MFIEERLQKVLEIVEKEGKITVKGLVDELEVSADTIRRDLDKLARQGLINRTHGGAMPATQVATGPRTPAHRYGEGNKHQQAIAHEALQCLTKGDTIFLGSASQHYCLAKLLPVSIPLRVVTSSLAIADLLKSHPSVETYILGGKVRESASIVDAFAVEFLNSLKLDICFSVGGGISATHGISTATTDAAALQRTAIDVSNRNIVLATHDKIGREAFARVAPLESADMIITDWTTNEDTIREFNDLGVDVIVASQIPD